MGKQTDYRLHLNFHGLGKPFRKVSSSEEDYWIDPVLFASVLDHVRGREDVCITVDDANESDYTIALPLLRERNLKACFFVVAERIDQAGFLSSQQLKTMCAEGMVIGNHGLRHSRWQGMSRSQLEEELITARLIIEKIVNKPVRKAACPFGSYDRRALQMLHREGYHQVFTSDGGAASVTAWMQPRNTLRRCHGLEEIVNLIQAPPEGAKQLWRNCKMTIKGWL